MFDRPSLGERVLLVQINCPPFQETIEEAKEFRALALSAGIDILGHIFIKRAYFDPKYYIGRGKVSELKQVIQDQCIELVIINHSLSPAQERNLERDWECRVLDRNALILDIFSKRAQSFEGRLQVELAQLTYFSTRLVRGWTHLERQKGGIGLRGPGEKQLELDKRLLHERLQAIHKKLKKVKKQRKQSRSARQRALLPTVAMVGYTNAGKSTLFNMLTHSEVYVADQLFATLDPTLRKFSLPQGGAAVLADTVGFMRCLPDNLVEAFQATLEETATADLLLHVVDATDPNRKDKMQAVRSVLAMIGAEDLKQIEIFNKVDCLDDALPKACQVVMRPCIQKYNRREKNEQRSHSLKCDGYRTKIIYLKKNCPRIWISSKTGLGLSELLELISMQLYGPAIKRTIVLSASESKLRAKLYEIGAVVEEQIGASGEFILDIKIAEKDHNELVASRSSSDRSPSL